MSLTDYDFVFKILLVGDSSVGKSSLLLRFSDNVFQESFLPTIGVDFKIRTIDHQGSVVKLQMWDTAGQEKFKTITSAYYKGAQGIVMVFDLTDKRSFDNIKNWIAECEQFSNLEPVKILVGNKMDMGRERQVSSDQARLFAESEGMLYVETSARTGQNVENIFQSIATGMRERFVTAPIPRQVTPGSIPLRPLPAKDIRKKHRPSCFEMFLNMFN